MELVRDSSSRPTMSLAEAARACRVSRNTLRRKLEAGQIDGAHRADDGSGQWIIPVDGLLGADLHPHRADQIEPARTPKPDQVDLPPPDQHGALVQRIQDLEHELGEWRRRAEVGEALAAEREKALDDLRVALRALSQGK